MLFLELTLSFVIGSLVASGLMLFIMCKLLSSPKIIKWYVNKCVKIMENYTETFDEIN